eukprot:TRINITY_DN25130_c0_g1_i1.p1 TRINITY_DN25130_c0_g1~~TRINITY_DN25130_c0_g1_i1.p1  ORF type:complete len:522 (+),score=140.43 TRINITY_DN25130_c0_g1_i1:74-1567(+)
MSSDPEAGPVPADEAAEAAAVPAKGADVAAEAAGEAADPERAGHIRFSFHDIDQHVESLMATVEAQSMNQTATSGQTLGRTESSAVSDEGRLMEMRRQDLAQRAGFASLLRRLDAKQNRVDAQWLRRVQEQERELAQLRAVIEVVRSDAADEVSRARRAKDRRKRAPWPPPGYRLVIVPTPSGDVPCLVPVVLPPSAPPPASSRGSGAAKAPGFHEWRTQPGWSHRHDATVRVEKGVRPLRDLLHEASLHPRPPPEFSSTARARRQASPSQASESEDSLGHTEASTEHGATPSLPELPAASGSCRLGTAVSTAGSAGGSAEGRGSDEEARIAEHTLALQRQQQHLVRLARRHHLFAHPTLLAPEAELTPAAPPTVPPISPPLVPAASLRGRRGSRCLWLPPAGRSQLELQPPLLEPQPPADAEQPPQSPRRPLVRRARLRRGRRRRADESTAEELRETAQLAGSLETEMAKAARRDRELQALVSDSNVLRRRLVPLA